MNIKLSKKAVSLAAGISALISVAAIAGPMYFQEIHYYSDASFTQTVGERTRTCTGLVVTEGQVTQYYNVIYQAPCGRGGL